MKRRDLERHLKKCGASLEREGGNHSIWRKDAQITSVPRHNEIKPTVVRTICRQLEIPPPRGR